MTSGSFAFALIGDLAFAMARGSAFAAGRSTAAQVACLSLAKEALSEEFSFFLDLGENKHVNKRRS